jgi:hypothetical protein
MNLPDRIAAAAALYDPTLMNELRVGRPERNRRVRTVISGESGSALLLVAAVVLALRGRVSLALRTPCPAR